MIDHFRRKPNPTTNIELPLHAAFFYVGGNKRIGGEIDTPVY